MADSESITIKVTVRAPVYSCTYSKYKSRPLNFNVKCQISYLHKNGDARHLQNDIYVHVHVC